MESDELEHVDLQEMEEWRRRNQEERMRMIDDYARWLKARGVVKVEARAASSKPARRGRQK